MNKNSLYVSLLALAVSAGAVVFASNKDENHKVKYQKLCSFQESKEKWSQEQNKIEIRTGTCRSLLICIYSGKDHFKSIKRCHEDIWTMKIISNIT